MVRCGSSLLILLLSLSFALCSGCSHGSFSKVASKEASPAICDDCRRDDFKNYVPCYADVPGYRKCTLCTKDCCRPGQDRCCCLHNGNRDCVGVCVTRKGK